MLIEEIHDQHYHMYWLIELNLTKFVTHVPEVVIVFLFTFAYFRFHITRAASDVYGSGLLTTSFCR